MIHNQKIYVKVITARENVYILYSNHSLKVRFKMGYFPPYVCLGLTCCMILHDT